MKKLIINTTLFVFLSMLLSGCGALEDLFPSGGWTGIFMGILIVALFAFLYVLLKRKRQQ